MTTTTAHIAHIGIAVADATASAGFYRDVLGVLSHALPDADGARIVSIPLGDDIDLELLEPLTADGPVAKFMAKRGPGIHHICYRVPDLDAALTACREHGYRLVDKTPRVGVHGKRIAFIHPKTTSGILIELTE